VPAVQNVRPNAERRRQRSVGGGMPQKWNQVMGNRSAVPPGRARIGLVVGIVNRGGVWCGDGGGVARSGARSRWGEGAGCLGGVCMWACRRLGCGVGWAVENQVRETGNEATTTTGSNAFSSTTKPASPFTSRPRIEHRGSRCNASEGVSQKVKVLKKRRKPRAKRT